MSDDTPATPENDEAEAAARPEEPSKSAGAEEPAEAEVKEPAAAPAPKSGATSGADPKPGAPAKAAAFELGTLLDFPAAIGWRDHAVGGLLALAYVAWLVATARSLGFPRDEGFYFHAASDYARWFDLLLKHPADAMQKGAIDGPWSQNHEHPALMKSLFGLSWMFLHQRLGLFSDASTAFRLPGMAMGGLSLWVTYLFGARAFSRPAGLVAAALLGLMPRVFFHAHLACFDVPIMTMWLVSVYVYWRATQEPTLGFVVAAGVTYGLALETKHNAWILPAVFVAHAVVVQGRSASRHLRAGRVQVPATLLSVAILGPLVFVALWPWLWSDTGSRIQEYMAFHLNHEYYNIEYLGKNYFGPPSPPSYAPVLVLATVPAITILLFSIGAADRLKVISARLVAWLRPSSGAASAAAGPDARARDRAETDVLLFLSFAAPLAVFFLPKTPIFGGTKHWFPAYPFLAIFAGRGFDMVARAARARLAGWDPPRLRLVPIALGAVIVLAPLAETIHSHPFGLSAYTPLVGGTAGGADLGLNRQFWGFTTESVAPFLATAPRGSSVFIHDTAWDSWARMQAEGRIRSDLRPVGSPSDAAYALVHHELHMQEVDCGIWMAYGTVAPAYVLRHDGVPIVSVYRRP